MPGVAGLHIELPGRRACPGGHCTPGVGSVIPGVELPGTPGVVLPGMRGVGAPGVLGVVGLGVLGDGTPPGAGVPPGDGVCAIAGPARIRLVAAIVRDVFQVMRLLSFRDSGRSKACAARGSRGFGPLRG